MRYGLLSAQRRTNYGYGLQLTGIQEKLPEHMPEAWARKARLAFGIHCLNHAGKMLCFILTSGCHIKKFFHLDDISLSEMRAEKQVILKESGISVEIFLSPGSYSDVNALYDFSFSVYSGSVIYGDRAYDTYDIEDELEQSDIHLNPVRKKNSKRKYESFSEDGIKLIRKRVESAFSAIKQKFPSHIHAVTARGFELKVFLFILAYGIEKTML